MAKLSPKIYAQILLESASDGNLSKIASSFWKMLQKNKQYKDLPKILELLDEEYAKKNGKVIAKVYSEESLTKDQEEEIGKKLLAISRKPVIIKNVIKPTSGGITIKIEDKIIDFSTTSKLNKLKKILN